MTIKVGSDFSGVGAFNQALIRLGIDYKEVFACDMDKYARQTFTHNYGEPFYYPENVYDRAIPTDPLDIYMTSPPCQAFSLAGKRKGEADKRGVLFYNSHEFIQVNNPRYFIFENVKGLLSDDNGKTFQKWIDLLGGKSVNGNPVIFPNDDAVPYHVYYQVLNAKHYGVPQNRERIFIIGIRDDADNNFSFPKPYPLVKRLKDVLEGNVDEKYFLSDKMLNMLSVHAERHNDKGTGFAVDYKDEDSVAVTIRANAALCPTYNILKVKSATSQGYEIATENDSINFSVPNSETRRGRVGKGVAQTLDTACNQGVIIGAIRGRNPDNQSDRTTGAPTEQTLELNYNGISNALTTVKKDNVVVESGISKKLKSVKVNADISGCLTEAIGRGGSSDEFASMLKRNEMITGSIRRLTPRECFRLMDFPDTFTWPVSASQAYKQAGNSIVVNCLVEIIKKLNL